MGISFHTSHFRNYISVFFLITLAKSYSNQCLLCNDSSSSWSYCDTDCEHNRVKTTRIHWQQEKKMWVGLWVIPQPDMMRRWNYDCLVHQRKKKVHCKTLIYILKLSKQHSWCFRVKNKRSGFGCLYSGWQPPATPRQTLHPTTAQTASTHIVCQSALWRTLRLLSRPKVGKPSLSSAASWAGTHGSCRTSLWRPNGPQSTSRQLSSKWSEASERQTG